MISGCSFSLVSKVKELLKSKGHKVSGSSRSTSTPVKIESVEEMEYTQDDSLIEHSDMQFVILEDATDLSNSGITHSEVAALNGSREHYEDDEITVVSFFLVSNLKHSKIWIFTEGRNGRRLPVGLVQHQPVFAKPQRNVEPFVHRLSVRAWTKHGQSNGQRWISAPD